MPTRKKSPEEVVSEELRRIRFVKLSKGEWVLWTTVVVFGIANIVLSLLAIAT